MKGIQIGLAIAFLGLFNACGGEEARPEVVSKFRAIGVTSNPVVAKPGDTVELSFFVAAPKDKTYNLNYLKDSAAGYSIPVLPTAIPSSQTETKFGDVSIYSFKANAIADATSKELLAAMTISGKARLRYGVQVQPTTESEDEKIVGDVLVYPAGSPEVSYAAPTIAIENLPTIAAGATQAIEAKITSTITESYRIGWFVSSGEIKNRRAKKTEWKAPGAAGEYTLIVTARGMTSGAFTYSAVKVIVQ